MLGYTPRTAAAESSSSEGSNGSGVSLKPIERRSQLKGAATSRFGPVIHEISTSAPAGNKLGNVGFVMSSEVDAVDQTGSTRFIYTYVFENKSGTTIRVTLVGTQLALSPLFELMQDFSLVLAAGEVKTFRFATTSEPELSPATAYNAAPDQQGDQWRFVSSGAVSLFLPVSLKAAFTFG
jgi:hypothetical protein